MTESYHDIENRIKDALSALKKGDVPNLSVAARQFNVPRSRLHHRFHGRPAKSDLPSHNRRFSSSEETALCRYLDRLDRLGLPAQRELLRGAADHILAKTWTPDPDNPNEQSPQVGNHWVARFLKRHPEYRIKRQKILDLERKQAEGYKALQEWFEKYKTECEKYGILPKDTWNMDETGFRIGIGRDQLVITKQQRQLYLGVPSNRESTTAIEAISDGGQFIPAFLILAGVQHMARWYENPNLDDDMVLAVSGSGYTNDQLSLE